MPESAGKGPRLVRLLAGAERGRDREYGMWTLDGAKIVGPSDKHLVASSFWLLPFPSLPSLPQARQTPGLREGAGKPVWGGPELGIVHGPFLEDHGKCTRETYCSTNTCFSPISMSYFWIQFSISVSTLYFF